MPDDQIDPLYPGGLELLGRHTVADRDVVLLIWPPEDLGHAPTIPPSSRSCSRSMRPIMALHIRHPDADRLARQLAAMTGDAHRPC